MTPGASSTLSAGFRPPDATLEGEIYGTVGERPGRSGAPAARGPGVGPYVTISYEMWTVAMRTRRGRDPHPRRVPAHNRFLFNHLNMVQNHMIHKWFRLAVAQNIERENRRRSPA